ncbi:MAG: L,D-transpeptidase family protein [Patescibacteria group bacterium]
MRKTLTRNIVMIICFFLLSPPPYLFAKEIGGAQEIKSPFRFEKVKKGGSLWEMFGTRWKTVAKINRISPERIREGMALKVPYDWKAAEQNAPIPHKLPGRKGKLVLIDLHAQTFGAYENGALVLWGPISSASGKKECLNKRGRKQACETPTGNFCVTGKDKNHVSKKYPPPTGGSPMKYGIRFFGDYWIHAGALPGNPDSHGCIRVLSDDAQWLFSWTNRKTAIIIM